MLDSFSPGNITIRLLLLLWTNDHPAQCEVCKSKGAGGKKGFWRCKLIGRQKINIENTSPCHYYEIKRNGHLNFAFQVYMLSLFFMLLEKLERLGSKYIYINDTPVGTILIFR